MGFFDFLKRKKVVGKQAVPATENAKPANSGTNGTTKAANDANGAKAITTGAPKTTVKANDPCAAITAAGTQCKSSSRDNSKYCGRHKGYRASATKSTTAKTTAKKSTKSTAKTTKSTAKTTKSTKSSAGKQVTHGEYKLYQNGNRFYFSKKTQAEAKQGGAQPVYKMPSARKVVVTPNGLPVLKKQ